MKRMILKLSAVAIATLLIVPVSIHTQDEKQKEKEKSDKKDVEQIIITRKGDNKEKVTVEINGDKVTVNGKPIEDLKDGDITVRKNKIRDRRSSGNGDFNYNFNGDDFNGMTLFKGDVNTAM